MEKRARRPDAGQKEIELYVTPFEEAMTLLQSVPGVGVREMAAASIIAEIGIDMTRFPSDQHLASWEGLCPGNKQSGGKRLSGKTTKKKRSLRAVLYEVAWVIAHMIGLAAIRCACWWCLIPETKGRSTRIRPRIATA